MKARPPRSQTEAHRMPRSSEKGHLRNHAASDTKAGASMDKGCVLLIEELASVRKVIKTMLHRINFEVITAKNGMQAFEIFKQKRQCIQIVICDFTMAGLDGWQTIAALRRLQSDIPVILTSGYDEERVMAGKHSEPPQAFLYKPFNQEELKKALARIVK